ncbi:unnamed protein product [Blepharisma stoltei]|uniref:Uncharacterized protein n=1 Tax=Blepharisma stoltei TaxID=1481888 RepID=A0AAU9JYF4_9CILI|nr:unnamed protein product [Blepharisma stoltei]
MSPKAAAKCAKKSRPKVTEEVNLYDVGEEQKSPEGWIKLELKHTLWKHGNFDIVIRTDTTIDWINRQIVSSCGRCDRVMLYTGDPTQSYNLVKNPRQTIGNLLQTFGCENKETPETYSLFYDFEPYHPDEPVLLA